MMRTVPPGGFAGYSQMTPASRASWGSGGSAGGRGRRRSKKKAKAGTKRRKKRAGKRAGKRGGKLKKGSAAAKARMAKLRKMRKK
jgi:hypothetical protein